MPAAAERRSEFGYDSHGGLTKDDERGDRPKLKNPPSNNITIFSVVRLLGTIMTIIVIRASTLIRPSGNGQTTDLDSGAGLFAAVTGPLFAGLKAVGKKGSGRGTPP